MKRIAVLLDGQVSNDSRLLRFIRAMSEYAIIDLFYYNGDSRDALLFNEHVNLYSDTFKYSALINHLFIHLKHTDLIQRVLNNQIKYDLVIANDYPTLYPGVEIAKALNTKLIYDSHEIYIETINQFYTMENMPFFKRAILHAIIFLAKWIGNYHEKKLMQAKELVEMFTVCDSLKEHFTVRLNSVGRDIPVTTIINCSDLAESLNNDIDIAAEKKALGLPIDKRLVLYQGNINLGRGLDNLIEAVPYLQPNIYLIVIGNGSLLPFLKQKASGFADRVLFTGELSREKMEHYTRVVDLGVLILQPFNLSKKYSLANKVFEYMASGTPELLTDMPEHVKMINETDAGFILSGDAPQVIAAKINEIMQMDPVLLKQKGENGKLWIKKKYNWNMHKSVLINRLKFHGIAS